MGFNSGLKGLRRSCKKSCNSRRDSQNVTHASKACLKSIPLWSGRDGEKEKDLATSIVTAKAVLLSLPIRSLSTPARSRTVDNLSLVVTKYTTGCNNKKSVFYPHIVLVSARFFPFVTLTGFSF
jgi:hypothetical protein